MTTPLIGRQHEIEALVDRLARARGGRAGLVFLRGAPGVGKSRLLAEGVAHAQSMGFRVLSGRADELERGVAYAPLRDALGPALAAEDNPLLFETVAEVRRSLLTPGDRGEPVGDEATQAFTAGERLLRAWADREPVLLAIDDLHAADDDTLAVISLLARTLRDTRVLLAATLRADQPDLGVELAAMVERLGGRPDVTVIDITALDDDDVVELATSHLATPPDDELAALLIEMTRGNPFYIEELLRAYREAGAIDTEGGRSRISTTSPSVSLTTRTAVLHRVFALGKDVRAVARVLTAFQRFDLARLPLVTALTGLDRDTVEQAFDVLVRARVVNAVGATGFEFAHPIVRATLDDDLGPAERRRIHSVIAQQLRAEREAGLPSDVLELATHVAHAAVAGDSAAADILAEAGDVTAARAPRSAAEWYARAIALLSAGEPRRGSLLARRSRSLYLGQRKADAAEAARDALAELAPGSGPDRERASVVLAASLRALGRMDEALAVTDELTTGESSALLAERASLLVQLDRFVEADEAATRALALARDPRSIAMARTAAAQSTYAQGAVEVAIAMLDDVLASGNDLLTTTGVSIRIARASYLAYAGRVPDAALALDDVDTRLAALGDLAFQTAIDPPAVWMLGLAGRWDDALERAHRATLEFERAGELFLLSLLRTMEAWILLERGATRDAADVLDTVTDTPSARSAAAWVRAGIDKALGRTDRARDVLVSAIERDRTTGRRSVLPQLGARLVDVELAVGNRDAAAALLPDLERDAALVGTAWAACLAARATALVRRDPDAARHAVELATASSLRYEAALSALAVAELDPGAIDGLRATHDELRALGAEPARRRAAHLLRTHGRAVPRGRSGPAGTLSATERQLARLVTEGMTNKEIANVLFLSPKTVEVYLSRLFVKAGCGSRVELAVAVKSGSLRLGDVE